MERLKGFFTNWKRRAVQLVSLYFLGEWSFYGIFRCPYAVPYIGCYNCPVIQCPGRNIWMWFWILIGISGLLMGRVFCGWACPGGLVNDIIAIFSVLKNRIKNSVSEFLSYGKYFVLVISLYYFFALNNPRWAIPIRTGEFFKSVALTFEHANTLWLTKTFVLLGIIALGLLIPHIWCRFFCPTGGALELFSKFSIFKYKMTESCNDCDMCRKTCALETRPKEENCTNCGDCVDICKINAIKIKGLSQKN